MKRTVLLVALLVISLSPIVFAASVLGNGFVRWSNPATPALNLSVDGGTLFVDSNKNMVGIGTSAPNVSLNVVGHTLTQGNATVTGNLSVDGGNFSYNADRDSVSIGTPFSPSSQFRFPLNIFSQNGHGISIYANGSVNEYPFAVNDKNDTTNFFVCRGDGNCGFGYQGYNEGVQLGVVGNMSVSENASFAKNVSVDGSTLFVDSSTNNVGIGTSTPGSTLSVRGSAGSGMDYLEVAGYQALIGFNRLPATGAILNASMYGWQWNYANTTVGLYPFLQTAGSAGAPTLFMDGKNHYFGVNTGSPTHPFEVVGNAYFSADVSALTFTDRTPYYEGDALTEISRIKGKNGEIDHETLPAFARISKTTAGVTEENRDLGAMVSVLTVAVQQLNTQNKEQQAKINALEARLAKLEAKAG